MTYESDDPIKPQDTVLHELESFLSVVQEHWAIMEALLEDQDVTHELEVTLEGLQVRGRPVQYHEVILEALESARLHFGIFLILCDKAGLLRHP